MIDIFALTLAHALMLIAAWRLVRRPELDDEGGRETGIARRKPVIPAEPGRDA
ncbi:MAG: hypothetical protein ABR601_04545 [Parasphingopyxis sp.]|nr:hypothetical protein [Sphingomonadales bacterium]